MRRGGIVVLIVFLAAAVVGCGSGSDTGATGSTVRRGTPSVPAPARRRSPGVGWKAPISKVVGFLRVPSGVGRLPGTEGTGAKGCQVEEGRGEIGIFADVPQPSCVRVSPDEPVSVVNRTGAYHRSEGHPVTLRIGPYGTRLRPQQAIRFGPVGRFLGRGYHQVRIGSGRGGVGILVLPSGCAIRRPEPGQSLCFGGGQAGGRSGASACPSSALAVSPERHSSIGSGGTIYTRFFVTNLSHRPCTLAGIPRVVSLDPEGRNVDVAEPVPLLRPGSRGGRPQVRIAPGEAATFLVAHYDGIGAGRCHFATNPGVRVSIPGGGARKFVVAVAMGYCPAPGSGLGLRVGRIESSSLVDARTYRWVSAEDPRAAGCDGVAAEACVLRPPG
jgi:hypothetical protein